MSHTRDYILEVKSKKSALACYKLVQLFEQKVFTMCYRIIRNREEAEEAAQDVFLKCFKNIDQLEDIDKFAHWLLKIAYSKSIDYVRKKKIKTINIDDLHISHDTTSGKEKSLEQSPIFERAIGLLEDEERAIINLYYQEDMSVKEIAGIIAMSESNVKIKLYRARIKIKNTILM